MVKTRLIDRLIQDAAILLGELDRRGFPVEAMFWSNDPEESHWRLIVASPIVAEQGPRAGYERLGDIFRELDLTGLSSADVSLQDPGSPWFESLRSAAERSGRLAREHSWVQYNDAVIYRWNNSFVKGVVSCSVTAEDLNRFWNAERKLSNLPRLLIDLSGQELTLRFHPDHGDLEDIQDVKPNFQSALHRPGARPDCHIAWLN
jgi:hypothetical protein